MNCYYLNLVEVKKDPLLKNTKSPQPDMSFVDKKYTCISFQFDFRTQRIEFETRNKWVILEQRRTHGPPGPQVGWVPLPSFLIPVTQWRGIYEVSCGKNGIPCIVYDVSCSKQPRFPPMEMKFQVKRRMEYGGERI